MDRASPSHRSYLSPTPPNPPKLSAAPPLPPPARGESSATDLTIASPLGGDGLSCVLESKEQKNNFLETHFVWVPSPPSCKREGHLPQTMVDISNIASFPRRDRRLDGSEGQSWVERGEITESECLKISAPIKLS